MLASSRSPLVCLLSCSLLLVASANTAFAADEWPGAAPKVSFSPGAEYSDATRMFQGIPAIERAANGRLWAAWYGGGKGEDQYNYIMLATSTDDGKTWSPLKLVIDPDGDGPARPYDPCLWHDPKGRLWLSWAQRGGVTPIPLWAIVTEDSGSENPKWSKPRPIARGIMMNKPIVTSDGRWLLPVANWKREGSDGVVVSADAGATFDLLGKATIPDPAHRNCDEHMLFERADKSLMMWVRTAYGIGQSISTDGGKTWPDVQPSSVAHVTSRFFIRRLASGNLLLVKHGPIDKRIDRSQLMAFISDDDAKTWHGGLMLDARKNVSYPDGVQAPDGSIYVIYDRDRYKEHEILMAKFTEQDVIAGKSASPTMRLEVLINKATGINPDKVKKAADKPKAP